MSCRRVYNTNSVAYCLLFCVCVRVCVSDWQTQTLAATVTLSIVTPSVTRALNSHCTNALFQFWSCCPAGVNGVISSEGAAACRDEKKRKKEKKRALNVSLFSSIKCQVVPLLPQLTERRGWRATGAKVLRWKISGKCV